MKAVQLQRRAMLRGAGAGMALPWLEAMEPRSAVASGAASVQAPVRMAFVFFANGAIMDQWKPQGQGTDYQFSPTLKPLEPFRDQLLVTSGLTQHHARANGDGGGDHARNAAAFLTGAQPRKTSGADISVGVSVDQAAARIVGDRTRLPSLELGTERGRNAGSCDSGYSCAYSSNISWRAPGTPTAKEINPKLAFERLFGKGQEQADRQRRDRYRRSILDFVAEDARRLRNQVSGTDRQKLDEYFTSVRDVEQRIDRAARMAETERPELQLPAGMPDDTSAHIRLMYDILLLAFQTDTTRIATYMLANASSNRTYPEVDVRSGHHELSHHRNDAGSIAQLARVDHFLVQHFAYFLERMQSVQEGDATLLDNSMILYGSGISDGNRHQHHDLPVLLAGGGGGTVNTGRYVQFPNETPLNNLFLSMSQRIGADIERLGNSTGRLEI